MLLHQDFVVKINSAVTVAQILQTLFSTITSYYLYKPRGTAVEQRVRCCATNRKVASSIPAGVFGIFH